jgi:phosphoglycerate dehydrogenase-like enzyme
MTRKPIIYVTRDPNLEDVLNRAAAKLHDLGWDVVRGPQVTPGAPFHFSPEQRRDFLSNVDIIVTSSRSRVTADDLDASPRLRGVVFPTIGVDAVSLAECASRGLIVANGATPENFLAMSEATIMLMLVLLYRLHTSEQLLRQNEPRPASMYARMLRGRRIGLIGLGRIGGGVAERLGPWGAEIVVHDPYLRSENCPQNVQIVPLEVLLRTADIVSLHVPLNDETRNIIGEKELRLMKPNAILVNTSRGGLVNEDALVRVMKAGHLGGVGLDVFATEPLSPDSPLRQLDRVVLTPHILGHTIDLYEVMPDVLIENAKRVMSGVLPLYTRNPEIAEAWKSRLRRISQ